MVSSLSLGHGIDSHGNGIDENTSSMPSLPIMKSAMPAAERPHKRDSIYIMEETLTDEDLFESLQRPEVDVSQTKPHGESRYTGRVLKTPDINRPTRNVVESIWMGLAAFVQAQLKQGRSVAIPNFGKFKHVTVKKGSKKQRKEPVFIWHDYFLEEHGIRARSVPKGLLDPEERELNYAQVGIFASVPKDTVVGFLRAAFKEIGQLCARSKAQAVKVRIPLYDVGRIW